MSCEVKGNSMCRLYYQLQFLILHGSELRDRKIEREREREKVLCWCRHVEGIGVINARVEG